MKRILTLFIVLLFVFGCEDTTTPDVSDLELQLWALITADTTLSLDVLNDGSAIAGDYEDGLDQTGLMRALGDTLDPESGLRICFGRRLNTITVYAVFDDLDNDTILAEITRTLTGDFIIVARDTVSGDTLRWEKPFTTDFQRRVRFVCDTTTAEDDSAAWRIDALTVGVGVTGSKVDITSLAFFTENGVEPLYAYTGNVLDTFIPRDELPEFPAWQPLRVEVTVTNAGPEFPYRSGEGVSLHYGLGPGQKGRRIINDAGVGADLTASDNVFTGLWLVHGPGRNPQNNQPYQRRLFCGFADVLDFGTLFAEDETVHSVFWALPYRSVRSN